MSEFAVPGLMPVGKPKYEGRTGTEPLRIIRGVTFAETWDVGLAENESLEGFTLKAEVHDRCGLRFDLAPTITDADAGIIRFEKTKFQTWDMRAGVYFTDVLLIHPDNTSEMLYKDLVVVVEDSIHEPEEEEDDDIN